MLLQRFVNFDVPLEHIGQQFRQVHTLLLGLGGKVLPYTLLDGGRQKDLRVRGNVVQTPDSLAEVDFLGHLIVVDGTQSSHRAYGC